MLYINIIKMSNKIKNYTRSELGYIALDFYYQLPFSYHEKSHDELIQDTVALLNKKVYYESTLDKITVETDGSICAFFRYEGWGEYHRYSFSLRLMYLNDLNMLVLVGNIEHDIHDLFEIIVRDKILPSWSCALGLLPVPYPAHYSIL
jgi:hypothetical protein